MLRHSLRLMHTGIANAIIHPNYIDYALPLQFHGNNFINGDNSNNSNSSNNSNISNSSNNSDNISILEDNANDHLHPPNM